MISYAQTFEDVMLWRALRGIERGFYIDVGAADPVEMSVTKAFHEAGWRGMNIEPSREYFDRLQADRPGDVNLNLAVAAEPGTRVFYQIPQTGLSTLDRDIAEEHGKSGWTIEARAIQVTTLAELCRVHAPGDIHFLKIDVEGAEGEVLAGADFDNFRPWIVLLEATRPLTTITAIEWETLILNAGYIFVWFDGLNRFYVTQERHAELRQHFQAPPNPFDNFVIHDGKTETRLAEQQEALAALRRDLGDAQRDLRHAQDQAALLEPYRQALEHLVFDLRWDRGPRALKLVLPLARAMRKLTRTMPPALTASVSKNKKKFFGSFFQKRTP